MDFFSYTSILFEPFEISNVYINKDKLFSNLLNLQIRSNFIFQLIHLQLVLCITVTFLMLYLQFWLSEYNAVFISKYSLYLENDYWLLNFYISRHSIVFNICNVFPNQWLHFFISLMSVLGLQFTSTLERVSFIFLLLIFNMTSDNFLELGSSSKKQYFSTVLAKNLF